MTAYCSHSRFCSSVKHEFFILFGSVFAHRDFESVGKPVERVTVRIMLRRDIWMPFLVLAMA